MDYGRMMSIALGSFIGTGLFHVIKYTFFK